MMNDHDDVRAEEEPESARVPLRVVNPGRGDVIGFPVRCGVPLAAGLCREVDELHLYGEGRLAAYQLTPLARWPDGSLRWVLVECVADVAAGGELALALARRPSERAPESETAERSAASRGHRSVVARARSDSPVPDLLLGDRALDPFERMDVELTGAKGERYTFRQGGGGVVEERGAVRSTFRCDGSFVDDRGERFLDVEVRLDLHGAPSSAALQLTVHNPRAARHAGGFWDLGDEGSRRFGNLSIMIHEREPAALSWRPSTEGRWHEAGTRPFLLTQLTSGGPLPDSPNHVDAAGRVPAPENGFRVDVGGERVATGERCSPHLRLSSTGAVRTLHLESFWENFPKAIEREGERLRVDLFPAAYPDAFELQGGEKKTHTLHVGFDEAGLDWVDNGTYCSVSREGWARADVLPYGAGEDKDEAMDALIEQGLSGADNFFVKRERIDEYGWRNFGDVHADHETWNLDSSEPFSSHYNNQYDLLHGFVALFARTGRPEWYRLAHDLAGHVIDIDVYDTRADRAEYNGGLFWHTDHYRPALTCTHRTYSVRHPREDGEPGGGGPGGEHCYTSGLKLYHFVSGCERARATALELARWVGNYYDGGGTLLETLYGLLRSRARTALGVLRGGEVTRHRYPVHRGIGNLVIAQLDAFELSGSRDFLERAERVVLGAIGPEDDLTARGLERVEENWFYSIFLQALIRYLDVKRVAREFDAPFFYARDSLLHYAEWVLERERPYLDDPDALEFPNHTWAAQDIRRCAILLDAYRYSPSERPDLLARSRFFARHVVASLADEPTRSYTRILAILMQSHGASAQALADPERHRLPPPVPYAAELHRPHTLGSLVAEEGSALLGALRRLSPRAEWRWLRARLPA